MPKITINELNSELINAFRLLQSGAIDTDTARTLTTIAQTIINGAKVEVEFLRVTGGLGTGFFPEDMDGEDFALRNIGSTKNLVEKNVEVSNSSAESGSKLKVTPTQKEILDFLIKAGGESKVGVIGQTRYTTIRNLEGLEQKGAIVCVQRPKKLEFSTKGEIPPVEESNDCGTWKVTNLITKNGG